MTAAATVAAEAAATPLVLRAWTRDARLLDAVACGSVGRGGWSAVAATPSGAQFFVAEEGSQAVQSSLADHGRDVAPWSSPDTQPRGGALRSALLLPNGRWVTGDADGVLRVYAAEGLDGSYRLEHAQRVSKRPVESLACEWSGSAWRGVWGWSGVEGEAFRVASGAFERRSGTGAGGVGAGGVGELLFGLERWSLSESRRVYALHVGAHTRTPLCPRELQPGGDAGSLGWADADPGAAGECVALVCVGGSESVACTFVPHEGARQLLVEQATQAVRSAVSGVGSVVSALLGGWGLRRAEAGAEGGEGGGGTAEERRAQDLRAEEKRLRRVPARALGVDAQWVEPGRRLPAAEEARRCASALDPSGRAALVADAAGRVLLVRVVDGHLLHVWKGARDAQVAWLALPSRGRVAAVIFSRRYALLEVWHADPTGRLLQGGRICAVRLPKGARLLHAPHDPVATCWLLLPHRGAIWLAHLDPARLPSAEPTPATPLLHRHPPHAHLSSAPADEAPHAAVAAAAAAPVAGETPSSSSSTSTPSSSPDADEPVEERDVVVRLGSA
jgi:hypothetical protein